MLPLAQAGLVPRPPPLPVLLPVGRMSFGGAASKDFGGTILALAYMMDGLGTLK
jgi:hypothetical protein